MKPINIIRDVLYFFFHFNYLSNREVKKEMNNQCSHQFIGCLKNKTKALNLTWLETTKLDDDELKARIYDKVFNKKSQKIEPDYEVEYENSLLPRKRRKTRGHIYLEYRNRHGVHALKSSQYHAKVRRHLKWRKASMKQFYRPGEVLFIDYAGTRLQYQASGKAQYVYVFVACLGFSKKLFAFTTPDMTTKSWLLGLNKAFEYFGGVPEVVQCDNAKAMVTKAGQIAKLNDNTLEFSRHFKFRFDTSRVATPTDNANAEAAVKFITMNILVLMNCDLTFFSLVEINDYLLKEVNQLNNQVMQKLRVSRQTLYKEKEMFALGELISLPFALFIERKTVQVPKTYMLQCGGYFYSVPHELCGEKVELFIREKSLTVFHKGIEKVCHDLMDESIRNTYIPEHMPPHHQAEANKSKEVYLAWAHELGTPVEMFIELMYQQTKNPYSRQVGKVCSAIQKLYKRYDKKDFVDACAYAVVYGYKNYSELQMILRTRIFDESEEPNLIQHKNIRGKEYYEGNNHEH
jgi:transposase